MFLFARAIWESDPSIEEVLMEYVYNLSLRECLYFFFSGCAVLVHTTTRTVFPFHGPFPALFLRSPSAWSTTISSGGPGRPVEGSLLAEATNIGFYRAPVVASFRR